MDSLELRVTSYSFVSPSIPGEGRASIQIFGYDRNGKSVYVKAPYQDMLIVKYNEELEVEDLVELQKSLEAEHVQTSSYDYNIALITGPSMRLLDVIKDEDHVISPYGVYTTFFQQCKIEPYSTINIEKYHKFPELTTQDKHYRAITQTIVPLNGSFEIPIRLFFWDIETYTDSDEFTNPSRDPVTLISVSTVVGEDVKVYLLSRIKIDSMDGAKIIYYPDEKKLIEGFFELWRQFKPDRSITYNGFSYDIPYMIARATQLGVEVGQLGKIRGLNAWTNSHIIPTPIGREEKKRFITPGVEELDLILYFRLKYPWLPNHKLDTVAYNLLGEGKTGLSIERMFEIFRKGDPKEMKEAAEYSIQDAILLHRLYKIIIEDLEYTANSFHTTIEELLLLEPKEIVDKAVYNLDPGLHYYSVVKRKNNKDYTIAPEFGAYRDVYIYDYSGILNKVMRDSTDVITSSLADRTNNVGMKLTKALWDSRVTQTNYRDVTKYLDEINENPNIIEVNNNVLASINKLESLLLNYKYKCSFYVILSKVSRYIIYEDENKACLGISTICRPKYFLEKKLVDDWIESMEQDTRFIYHKIDTNSDIKDFVRSVKIYSGDEYSSVELKRILFEEVKPVTTFKNVKYVMTKNGPQVYMNQKLGDLNLKYYENELYNLYLKLKKISGENNEKVYY